MMQLALLAEALVEAAWHWQVVRLHSRPTTLTHTLTTRLFASPINSCTAILRALCCTPQHHSMRRCRFAVLSFMHIFTAC